MPQGGGTAGGNLLGALAPDKPDIRFTTIDPELQKRLGGIWSTYDASADPTANTAYLSAYAADTPEARAISQSNLGYLNRTVDGAYDPTAAYTYLLNTNKDALGSFLLNPALAELTRQRKATQARLGYGGQGAGTYDTLLNDRILQQLASQSVPGLLNATNQAYATSGQQRQQDIANRLGIIGSGEQFKQLNIPAMRYLEPKRLARSDVQANLGNLSDIQRQQDLNRAYYRKKSGLEKAGGALNAFQSGLVNEANDALSLYSGAMSGGILGGGGGGGGGIMSMFGGGGSKAGGGGGGDTSAILSQLLQMYGGRGGGGSSTGVAGNPWATTYNNPDSAWMNYFAN